MIETGIWGVDVEIFVQFCILYCQFPIPNQLAAIVIFSGHIMHIVEFNTNCGSWRSHPPHETPGRSLSVCREEFILLEFSNDPFRENYLQ